MNSLVYFLPIFGVIGLVYMFFLQKRVTKQDARRQQDAGYRRQHRQNGAMAFLKAEYRILAIYVVIAGALLGWLSTRVETSHPLIVVAFVIGALFSVLAGFFGMRIATQANVRTTQAARSSLSKALQVSSTAVP
jgi:K(+)-stimulated pyrophosphate-energized sodium pump